MLFNTARASMIMRREGVDAILATSAENTFYFCGLWSCSSLLHPCTAQIYVLLREEAFDKPVIIVPTTDADCIFECFTPPVDVLTYGTFYRELYESPDLGDYELEMKSWTIDNAPFADPISALIEAIIRNKLESSVLAIDEKVFDSSYFHILNERFPRAKFVHGTKLIQEIRAVKTTEEINRLRAVCKVNEKAIYDSVSIITEGTTEHEVLLAFRKSLAEQGALTVFESINFGKNTGFGNLYATNQPIKKGSSIRYDVGCRYQGYISDLARIFSFGEPSEKVRKYYNALRIGNEAGVAALRPGVLASDIFKLVVATVRESGIPHYKRHHTGHGIGVEIYQPPLIAEQTQIVLEAGMVFAIESPYFEMGFAGLQLEDMVVITQNGAEYLNTSSRDLIII